MTIEEAKKIIKTTKSTCLKRDMEKFIRRQKKTLSGSSGERKDGEIASLDFPSNKNRRGSTSKPYTVHTQ